MRDDTYRRVLKALLVKFERHYYILKPISIQHFNELKAVAFQAAVGQQVVVCDDEDELKGLVITDGG